MCFEAECVSYFSPTLEAVQPDLSPVEISSLLNIGNLCAGSLSTLPPNLFPILTLIAVDHVAKLAYIVFIDLHLLAFHKCRYSPLDLGDGRERERGGGSHDRQTTTDNNNNVRQIDEIVIDMKNVPGPCLHKSNGKMSAAIYTVCNEKYGGGGGGGGLFQVAKKVDLLAIMT